MWLVLAIFCLIAAFVAAGAKFVRFPRFLVVRRWGKFARLAPSGFNWLWPLADEGEEREEKVILVDNIKQEGIFTSDNVAVVVDSSFEWKLASTANSCSARLYLLAEQEGGEAGVSKKLQNLLREALLKVFRTHASLDNERGSVMPLLDDATTEAFEKEALDKFGVVIVSFNLENYRFADPAIEAGLEAPKKAELEAQAQIALRNKEAERKETEKARGEADSEYHRAVAVGEAERLRQLEEVKTKALKDRADALQGKEWHAAVGAAGVEIARAVGDALNKKK
jgi:regulator of protease activity HflC (stomatin/prohibitin superfamily)